MAVQHLVLAVQLHVGERRAADERGEIATERRGLGQRQHVRVAARDLRDAQRRQALDRAELIGRLQAVFAQAETELAGL